MINMLVINVRNPELTREEFSEYWRDRHAPLVMSVPEFMKHVRKYVQFHAAPGDAFFGDLGDWDGLGWLQFDSLGSAQEALSDPTYLRVIKPDEHRFLDIPRCTTFIGEEVPQFLGGRLYSGAGIAEGSPLVRPFEVL